MTSVFIDMELVTEKPLSSPTLDMVIRPRSDLGLNQGLRCFLTNFTSGDTSTRFFYILSASPLVLALKKLFKIFFTAILS